MEFFYRMVLLILLFVGCSQWRAEPYPGLMETEKGLVSACDQVGIIAETADAGRLFAEDARARMILRVQERAAGLGATHIVWLHRTAHSAAAEAYRCPPPN